MKNVKRTHCRFRYFYFLKVILSFKLFNFGTTFEEVSNISKNQKPKGEL